MVATYICVLSNFLCGRAAHCVLWVAGVRVGSCAQDIRECRHCVPQRHAEIFILVISYSGTFRFICAFISAQHHKCSSL